MRALQNFKDPKDVESIWIVTREYRGVAGAGGVKDVSRDLAESLARAGYEVSVIMPRYGFVKPEDLSFKTLGPQFNVDANYAQEERSERVGFWHQKLKGVDIILVEASRFSEKLGVYTYTAEEEIFDPSHKKGEGHLDYFAMNILLQKAALEYAIFTGTRPDVFHCQDGHTGVLPAMMREIESFRHYFKSSSALLTIHNAGLGYHQDVADLLFAMTITGLPQRTIYGAVLNGSFNPFLVGAAYAPINTVSENYARELQETELDALTGWLGHALKDRGIFIEGITNGINPDEFSPSHPEILGLPAAFDPARGDLAGKAICRKELVIRLMFAEIGDIKMYGTIAYSPSQPLVTVVSRFSEQKGLDILGQALENLLAEDKNIQVVILGNGNRDIENHFISLAKHLVNEERLAVIIGYDPGLANLIYAAGDFFVIPSRYEPCGLTDFMAQLMGNLPIVRTTGGLVKVRDGFNGFSYKDHTSDALTQSLNRALKIHRNSPDTIKEMQVNAVRNIYENYTWDKVREKYIRLYRKAMKLISK
ncbi:MAG: glycogen/starch synthase [Deltaproteobacteria bacterium]|nr:glycogen/starch synthase [Deltaproteobacteria bacterium]